MNGSLTLNGSTTTNTTALNVRDGFTISGPTGVQQFGPIYVGGECNWSGGNAVTPLKVQTTDYTDPDPDQSPGPLWTGFLKCPRGVYSHVLGPTWVVGNAGTTDVAIQFSPSSSSLVLCPLMATTEKIETSGPCSFGTLDKPMVLYMVCDNDNLYTNTCVWNSSGTFTGLMVVMEAAINPGGGNDGAVKPATSSAHSSASRTSRSAATPASATTRRSLRVCRPPPLRRPPRGPQSSRGPGRSCRPAPTDGRSCVAETPTGRERMRRAAERLPSAFAIQGQALGRDPGLRVSVRAESVSIVFRGPGPSYT